MDTRGLRAQRRRPNTAESVSCRWKTGVRVPLLGREIWGDMGRCGEICQLLGRVACSAATRAPVRTSHWASLRSADAEKAVAPPSQCTPVTTPAWLARISVRLVLRRKTAPRGFLEGS